jgi:LuxR family maltose regulon positive regulatory protein
VEQLITTKLYIPPTRTELVSRPRLIEQLNDGLHRKLTLLSAPAGFGKTTLVGEWVEGLRPNDFKVGQIENRVAWLSLDENDNDPTRFLAYLIAALQTIEVNFAKGLLSAFQSPQPPPIEAVLTSLVNEMAADRGKMILVLDDYHTIESTQVESALTFFLEHLPPQIHIVIATRVDPQLPITRLRVSDQLTELRAADLRFTPTEAADFLNQVMGLDLSAADIAALETRTEGWIAGLQLAAISMQGLQDTSGFIKTFTGGHHFVLDYLIEEVLERQSEPVQDFLIQTSILDRLNGSLCDTLTGQKDGQATLNFLETSNLFIIPLDSERRWYRYHHLFIDLLRQRLRQRNPDQILTLHRKASAWYEQNGFTNEAIEHALRSEDFERAADMIRENVDHVLYLGEDTKLRRWLDKIPVDVTFSKPYLCILLAGNNYIRGQVDEAKRYLQAAEKALDFSTSAEADTVQGKTDQLLASDKMKLWGRAATVRSFLVSYQGDMEGAIQYARQALEYLPKSDVTWRCSAFDSLASTYSSIGDCVSAYHARLEALETSKATGNVYMMLFANLRLVVTLRDLGRLRQAIEICQEQLKLANESGLSQTALVGWLYTLWSEILAEKNELDRAIELVNKGVELTEQGKDLIILGNSYLSLMKVLFSKGDMELAQKTIHKANNFNLKRDLSPYIKNQLAAWQARIWLEQDKLISAYHWAENLEFDFDGELTPIHYFDYVVLARILIAQGRLDETSRLLRHLLEAAEAGGCTSRAIEIQILQALASQANGDTTQALDVLERALTLAEPGGFIRIFVDAGPPMAHLLHEALSHGIDPKYIRLLLGAFSSDEPMQADATTYIVDQSGLIEPLSERELEVLQHIAEGLTNREIARRLYLSLNTIKVHTRNIYGKLGVNNRTQAVAEARSLEILPLT